MRSGGGLGEFSTGSTQLSVAASCERLGNRDATWPSGPRPSSMASKTGSPAAEMQPSGSRKRPALIYLDIFLALARHDCVRQKRLKQAIDALLVPDHKLAVHLTPAKPA